MDYISFMRQYGVRLYIVLSDDSACKKVYFKVKMVSKHPYLCPCLLSSEHPFGGKFDISWKVRGIGFSPCRLLGTRLFLR